MRRVCPNCGTLDEIAIPRPIRNRYPHPAENERISKMSLFDPEPFRRYPNGTTNLVKELPIR